MESKTFLEKLKEQTQFLHDSACKVHKLQDRAKVAQKNGDNKEVGRLFSEVKNVLKQAKAINKQFEIDHVYK